MPKHPRGSAIRDDRARALHPSYPRNSLRAVAEMRALGGQVKRRIAEVRAPLLVMHAREDSLIAPANAPWILAHASSPIHKLLWVENSDHIITEDFESAWVVREAVAWIEAVAKGAENA